MGEVGRDGILVKARVKGRKGGTLATPAIRRPQTLSPPFVSLGSPGHSFSSLSCPNQPLIPNPNPNLTLTPNSWKFTPIHLRFLSPPWNLFDAILHTQALDIPQPWRALRTISEPLSPGRSLIWTRAWADWCSPLHPPRKIPLPLPLSMPRYQLQLLLLLRLCRLRWFRDDFWGLCQPSGSVSLGGSAESAWAAVKWVATL